MSDPDLERRLAYEALMIRAEAAIAESRRLFEERATMMAAAERRLWADRAISYRKKLPKT